MSDEDVMALARRAVQEGDPKALIELIGKVARASAASVAVREFLEISHGDPSLLLSLAPASGARIVYDQGWLRLRVSVNNQPYVSLATEDDISETRTRLDRVEDWIEHEMDSRTET